MEIYYSEHLKTRLKLRKIPEEIVKKIYFEADERFYDKDTQNLIAIKKILFQGKEI